MREANIARRRLGHFDSRRSLRLSRIGSNRHEPQLSERFGHFRCSSNSRFVTNDAGTVTYSLTYSPRVGQESLAQLLRRDRDGNRIGLGGGGVPPQASSYPVA